MAAIKIIDGVHYVGIFDHALRVFDVIMVTEHGTTYNSYLITGEKNVVIDAVKEGFADDFLENISEVIDPKDIDYIVVNHTEPDHSSGLKKLLKAAPNAVVYASKPACAFLKNILNEEFPHHAVEDGETLDLGGKTLRFIKAPYLHWPDTIFTYLEEDNILFTCDAFGAHHCDDRLFNDLIGDFSYDFRYYFDHIMRPFKEHVVSACDKIADIDISILCPSHGPVLRSEPQKYIDEYRRLSQIEKSNPRAIIVYVTAYGNTKLMAENIKSGLEQKGIDVMMYDVSQVDIHSFLEDFERSDALILGSPTINGDALKPIHDILSSLATVKIKGMVGGAFGSYGWSGEAVKIISDRMKSIKFKAVEPGVRVRLIPTEEELAKCVEYGTLIGDAILPD